MTKEALFYNACVRAYQADYRLLKKIREAAGSWETAWNSHVADIVDPGQEQAYLDKAGVDLILKEDALFPPLLCETPWVPQALYIQGNAELLTRPAVAVVGSRRAGYHAKHIAKKLASELAARGISIVSGLAIGIDEAAHQGALLAGGPTIAVLPRGLDRPYPRLHTRLARTILDQGGLLVSEYPFGSQAFPSRFLERNRIISGLSLGTVIVAAPERSGSLATARFALEANREVFVVPGASDDASFRGSHELIRAGAQLVTGAGHILQSLALIDNPAPPETRAALPYNADEALVLKAIRHEGGVGTIDKIVELTNLEIQVVNQTLTFLVLKNAVQETDYGWAI